jgi:hypothetical protein
MLGLPFLPKMASFRKDFIMRTLTLTVLAFFMTLTAASAGQLWTATGSAGTIDPAVISAATIGTSTLGFNTSTTATTISARYNVTIDDTTAPTWRTIEILANDQGLVNGVFASVYSVNRTTGATSLLASVGSTGGTGLAAAYVGAIGTSVTFDFTSNYYVVRATVIRTSTSNFPTLQGIRLY